MRTSDGCLSCKHRKKKCDGVQPLCLACERNGLICAWPAKTRRDQRDPRDQKDQRPSSPRTRLAAKPHGPRRSSVWSLSPSPPSPFSSLSSASPPDNLIPKPQLSSMFSLLPACLSRPASSMLWSHYLAKTGVVATARVGHVSPFLDMLIPPALASNSLLHALVAFSGFHLMQRSPEASLSQVATLEHYSQCLRALKFDLTRYASGDTELGVTILLTILVLTYIEISHEDSGLGCQAIRHLHASRTLAQSVLGGDDARLQAQPAMWSFLLELYAYTLAISSLWPVETPDKQLAEDVEFVFATADTRGIQLSGYLLGSAGSLFRLLPKVVDVSADVQTALQTTGVIPSDCIARVDCLQRAVEYWSPDATDSAESADSTDSTNSTDSTDLTDPTSLICSEIYRLVLLTLLKQCGPGGSGAVSETTSAAVDDMISLLRMLPLESGLVTTLCCPLATLGAWAMRDDQRAFIRIYLENMRSVLSWANIASTLNFLKFVWDSYSTSHPSADQLDIRSLMRKQGTSFLLI